MVTRVCGLRWGRLVGNGRAVRGPGLPVRRGFSEGVLVEGGVAEGVVEGILVERVRFVVRGLVVLGWRGPFRVVEDVRVVHGRGVPVLVGGEVLQVCQDGFGCRAAAGQGRLVQGQGPHLVGGGLVQGRVLLVVGGFVRPGLDLAVPGLAVFVEGLEERGRASAFLLGGAPPVAGAEEEGAGAGEGDVAEAEFLGVLVLLHGLVEGFQAPGVPGRDVGEGGGVAAQFVRQDLALGGPLLAALAAGEGAGDQAGDDHDVPFQALGLVGGEHLDGVLAAGEGVVEALLVLGGGAQEAEEGEQRRLVVAGGEGGADVQEVGQGLAAAGGQGVRGRRQLDLQAGDGEDAVQDVHQRVGQGAAQFAQFGGEAGEAYAGLG